MIPIMRIMMIIMTMIIKMGMLMIITVMIMRMMIMMTRMIIMIEETLINNIMMKTTITRMTITMLKQIFKRSHTLYVKGYVARLSFPTHSDRSPRNASFWPSVAHPKTRDEAF